MDIILENEMTLERLQNLFQSKQLPVEMVKRDDYLKIGFPNSVFVAVWIDQYIKYELRMRVVLCKRDKQKLVQEIEWLEFAAQNNQQLNFFGAFSPNNILGVTLEYRLPFTGGILDQTIWLAAERLVGGALLALSCIEDM